MQQEQRYQLPFRNSITYKLVENQLEIYDASGEKALVFESLPEYPIDPTDLIGTHWTLDNLNGRTDNLNATLTFETGNTATGQAGNWVTHLNYAASGDTIHVLGVDAVNRLPVFTPSDQDRLAGEYTSVLAFMSGYHLSGDRLEIFTIKGAILVFKRL
jgi:hypothetical protein